PGDPALARRVQELLKPLPVGADLSWGLDHGSWSVLCHLYPQADVPVVQLSIDARRPPAFHYRLGQQLAELREEGVLLLGSGDVVHNLAVYVRDERAQPPYEWALRFEDTVRTRLEQHQDMTLVDYPALGEDAHRSVPTPEHYLPLLYIMGARRPHEPVS